MPKLPIIALFFVIVVLRCIDAAENCPSVTRKSTTKMLQFQEVLSRKKRYLLFTPGSAFLVLQAKKFFDSKANNIWIFTQTTMSFAKALATKFPRGVNMVAEADLFYPLPTKISDWYPKPHKAKPKIDDAVPPLPPATDAYYSWVWKKKVFLSSSTYYLYIYIDIR